MPRGRELCTYCQRVASSPGPSQILSRSCGEKSGEGLGSKSKLRHGPEMVDSVCTNPRTSPDFSPWLRDKIWEGPGDEASQRALTTYSSNYFLSTINLNHMASTSNQ